MRFFLFFNIKNSQILNLNLILDFWILILDSIIIWIKLLFINNRTFYIRFRHKRWYLFAFILRVFFFRLGFDLFIIYLVIQSFLNLLNFLRTWRILSSISLCFLLHFFLKLPFSPLFLPSPEKLNHLLCSPLAHFVTSYSKPSLF